MLPSCDIRFWYHALIVDSFAKNIDTLNRLNFAWFTFAQIVKLFGLQFGEVEIK